MSNITFDNATLKKLCKESARRDTFKNWPLEFLSAKALAKNGFFYAGEHDHVICIFCGVEVGDWEIGDKIEEEHMKHSPDCSVFLQTDANRISRRSHDEHSCVIGYKKRVNYDTLEARFNTYKDWPISMKQLPKDMARAGFFYTGKGDKVMCFSCEVGLNNWEEADEPWFEHAKWSPKCELVLREKGEQFVQEVHEKVAKSKTEENEKIENDQKESLPPKQVDAPLAPKKSITDDQMLCRVCLIEPRTMVSLPCRHLATCVECHTKFVNCPICRQEEEAHIKVYIP